VNALSDRIVNFDVNYIFFQSIAFFSPLLEKSRPSDADYGPVYDRQAQSKMKFPACQALSTIHINLHARRGHNEG
ncbi:MAG: hypothetical protein ACOYOS_12140, partial [Syntrophales bacterium]